MCAENNGSAKPSHSTLVSKNNGWALELCLPGPGLGDELRLGKTWQRLRTMPARKDKFTIRYFVERVEQGWVVHIFCVDHHDSSFLFI